MPSKRPTLQEILSHISLSSLSSLISKTHNMTTQFSISAQKQTANPSPHDSVIDLSLPPTPHHHQSTTTAHPPTHPPTALFTLPLELIHIITTYLSPRDTSSFLLSSHNITYALGTLPLSTFLSSTRSKHTRRQNLELIERAFPSHWYCAWCDRFHEREQHFGPRSFYKQRKRECDEYAGFLHVERNYVLTFAHVRAVVNGVVWGTEYGMSVSELDYNCAGSVVLYKSPCRTRVVVAGKVLQNPTRLLLHSSFEISIPRAVAGKKDVAEKLFPHLPHIVIGHRNDHSGHSGLKAVLQRGLGGRSGRSGEVRLCSVCATDYVVGIGEEVGGDDSVVLRIESWRDLGDVRNPFAPAWRAHGELGHGFEGYGSDMLRLTRWEAGEIRGRWVHGHTRGIGGFIEKEGVEFGA